MRPQGTEVDKHLSVGRCLLTRIDDVHQSSEGKRYFFVLDLVSGFLAGCLEDDKHKTAFVTTEELL